MMTVTKFSRRNKFLFLGLLALLNIVMRIPSIPHERGSPDEFTMHILANSLATFGHAKWWIHPSSIFGFYPYSYASSSPFAYSGISQCTGINLEWIACIFCALLGIFVMLSAYILAGQIKNDDLFRFLVAFTVSLSQGVLTYLTWQISARGLFIALLPFFIYLLLKSRASTIRYGALTFAVFILLMATHHLYILTVPIAFSFIVLIIFYKLKEHIAKFVRLPNVLTSIAIIAGIFGMFSIPFFTGLFIHGSKYNALFFMVEQTIRYSGPFSFLAIAGISYLVLKRDREFGEWFLLLIVIFWAPFMWIGTYAHYFVTILLCILICIALVNIARAYKVNRKQVYSTVVVVLLLFVSFSGFYQHWRTNIGGTSKICQWYVEDTTYNGALWVGNNINKSKKLIGSSASDHMPTRVFAISEVPTLVMPEVDITYGFVNVSSIRVTINSPLSTEFYMDNPYILPDIYPAAVLARWSLGTLDIDNSLAKNIINKYNISYYIEDINCQETFVKSLREERKQVPAVPLYDNGRIRIWCLNEL